MFTVTLFCLGYFWNVWILTSLLLPNHRIIHDYQSSNNYFRDDKQAASAMLVDRLIVIFHSGIRYRDTQML